MDEPLSCTSYNATAPPPRVMALATPAFLAIHSAPVPFAAADRSKPPMCIHTDVDI